MYNIKEEMTLHLHWIIVVAPCKICSYMLVSKQELFNKQPDLYAKKAD